jgi:RING-box protein 1
MNGFEIEIEKFNVNLNYELTLNCDTCSICRNLLTENCIECNNDIKDCYAIVGKCNHLYHNHCIKKWMKTRKTCPLCNKYFSLKEHRDKCYDNKNF